VTSVKEPNKQATTHRVATTHVVATAGHVDHGKSSLVMALTGTDPDRWAEEKKRGLTIDLGFAHTTLASGAGVGFVDVPGHVRFLKNMLAGVGAVDACIFVVAATEGWKPQSEEHLRILQLLGMRHGIIALTKVDAVDSEWAELAQLDVTDHVAGTFLEDAPIISVSAHTGEGLPVLRETLDTLLGSTPHVHDRNRPRLWVDRVFAAKGAGTVVTGTLASGSFHVDDDALLLGPTATRGLSARVRSLQSHGVSVLHVGPGNRVAVNLGGVNHEQTGRGDALVIASDWHRSTRFDATITVLESLDHDLSRRGAFAVYVGSGEYTVKVRVLGADVISPGGEGFVRIHLPTPLPLMPGDRFILRDHGRSETIGGGEILDVAPVRPASKAQPSRDLNRIVAERGWIALDELMRLTGDTGWNGDVVQSRWAVDADALAKALEHVRSLVDAAGSLGLDLAALSDRERLLLDRLGPEGIAVTNGRLRRGEVRDPLADHPFVALLEASPFQPPDATGVDRTELRELIRRKLVIEHDGVHFAPKAIIEASTIVARLLRETPDGFTVAAMRDTTGATRKHIIPLLAYLDANGITRRRGDLRIAGPRLSM
jgi:selenocysteine-specific elongation factor